ncbi:hypothetical protein GOBAR_DD29177 [Gossypium barbadense]|nr:hypothetical protein GOBAR_DD29177 [Gossypium barbadense]
MSAVADTLTHWFNFPENIEKLMFPSRTHESRDHENKGCSSIPADILDTPKEFIFYLDVPGLSKSDIQVTVEDENTLVIKSAITAKCENGVLTVVVEKLPPPPKPKTVEVAIA